MKYSEFLSMSKNVTEKAGTGSVPFLGTFMKPIKKDVDLPTEVLELLVEYYCNTYEYAFVTILNIYTSSEDSIIILSKVNQFSRLRVGAEVFGSTYSPRYIKSANLLSQFVIDDNTTDIYPGQVQFLFRTYDTTAGRSCNTFVGFCQMV